MEFTRQPIIETVITAKEGFKLVVRSSKNASQEEYFVDAVEVVSFGNAFFFRSMEKPKAFLAPVTDYEVLEVREARMVLKNVGLDKAIKIGGGKETLMKVVKEPERIQEDVPVVQEEKPIDRKRDRRRGLRRRREREEGSTAQKETSPEDIQQELVPEDFIDIGQDQPKIDLPEPKKAGRKGRQAAMELSSNVLKSLLTPPPNLISDTIEKYRDDDLFKGVFITKEAQAAADAQNDYAVSDTEAEGAVDIQTEYHVSDKEVQSVVDAQNDFHVSDKEDEEIYRQRVVAKEHESEHYYEGIEEGPSSVVQSFTDQASHFEPDLQETPRENFREDEPESKL